MQFLVLAKSVNNDYLVRKGAMFGELFKIRNEGFEKNRYLNQIMQNILKEACKKQNLEYKRSI